MLDIVTNRKGRPAEDLLALLAPNLPAADAGDLTAVSYRPLRIGESETIELRVRTLAVGAALPELPLGLNAGLTVDVDFEACYEEARSRSRL